MEQAEEFTVSGDEGTDETVEAGRDALGNGEEEEESEAAAEVALESSELQGDIEDDSTEAEVRKVLKNDDHGKWQSMTFFSCFEGWCISGPPTTFKCY